MNTRVCLLVVVASCFAVCSQEAFAHKVFEKTLEKQVKNLNASCATCHFEDKEKTERNEFGQLFFEEFKGMDLSKKWNELDDDRPSQKKLEKEVMAPALIKAWKKVQNKKEKKTGETYGKLAAEFKLEGCKEKPSKKKKN